MLVTLVGGSDASFSGVARVHLAFTYTKIGCMRFIWSSKICWRCVWGKEKAPVEISIVMNLHLDAIIRTGHPFT